MIAVVQRVTSAKVTVAGEVVGAISRGMVVLASVETADTDAQITWMAAKLAGLRIFQNADKYFDLDIKQISGGMLLVSNFTVAAETGKGRRPGLSNAAPPEQARILFDTFVEALRAQGVQVETGRFGAEMSVEIVNDGPATFIVRSEP
jgi:D-tyrosyl-tRNA(Tyr) deacylase